MSALRKCLRAMRGGGGLRCALIVQVVLGATLITAGGLKTYQLAAGKMAAAPVSGGPLALGALTSAELALGAWLLSGWRHGFSRAAAGAAFAVMFGTSLYSTLGGETSCGCFGEVQVPPGYMAAFDAAAVLALGFTAGVLGRQTPVRMGRGAYSALALGAGASVAVAVAVWAAVLAVSPAQLRADGQIVGHGKRITVNPAEWVGARLPALNYIDRRDSLGSGDWLLVFHNHGCVHCQRAGRQLRALASERSKPRLAFVEVPPYAADASRAPKSSVIDARLSDEFTWAFPLPTMLRVHDGRVTELTSVSRELMLLALDATEPTGRALEDAKWTATWRKSLVSQVACGPLALIAVLGKLGVPISEEDKDVLMGAAGTTGTDLATLKELAEKHGLHALGVETTVAGLHTRALPAIAFVRGYGFAAVTDYSRSDVRVVYPFASAVSLPDARFEKEFGTPGRALLLSRSPIALGAASERSTRPHGPLPRASRSMLAFGRVYRKSYEAAVDLFNDGEAPVEITQASASTPKLTVTVTPRTIAPGGKARVSVVGHVDAPGPVTESVSLVSNSVEGPVMRLPVRGYVDVPAFLPQPYVLFDGVVEGVAAEDSIPVELPAGVDRASLVCATTAENECAATLEEGDGGKLRLRVRWTGAAGSGWHRLKIEIRQDAFDAVAATADVAAHVLPALSANPESLWISDAELAAEKPWWRQFTLRRNARGELRPSYRWSDDAADVATKVSVMRSRDGGVDVRLEPRGNAAASLRGTRAALTVSSDDGAQAVVTVRFGDGAAQNTIEPSSP